ncbi:MAG: hypothetical protein D6706_02130 [Chloroflexi bacterium]|nr:MAG: hypothetical protein D6706_02130 [Chloroflexota bacterium]
MSTNNGVVTPGATPAAGLVTSLVRWLAETTGCQTEHAETAVSLLTEIGKRYRDEQRAAKKVAELEQLPRCCGREWFNNAGSMYVHHSLGDNCPVHGEADSGAARGLRTYIGRRDDNQAAARAAIRNWVAWVDAKNKHMAAQRKLDRILFDMKRIGANY